MALSDQLSQLAARTKELEDRAAAAKDKARADVEREVNTARDASQAKAESLHQSAKDGQADVSAWWNDIGRSWNEHVATIRKHIDDKKAAHDLKSAQRDAELADEDASYAIDYAYAAVEEAEYAVLDSILANIEADELAAGVPAR